MKREAYLAEDIDERDNQVVMRPWRRVIACQTEGISTCIRLAFWWGWSSLLGKIGFYRLHRNITIGWDLCRHRRWCLRRQSIPGPDTLRRFVRITHLFDTRKRRLDRSKNC